MFDETEVGEMALDLIKNVQDEMLFDFQWEEWRYLADQADWLKVGEEKEGTYTFSVEFTWDKADKMTSRTSLIWIVCAQHKNFWCQLHLMKTIMSLMLREIYPCNIDIDKNVAI